MSARTNAPRTRIAASARLLIGVVAAAAFAVGTATAVVLPWPGVAREPASVSTLPEPAASVASCVGPILALGRDSANASGISVDAPQQIAVGSASTTAPATGTTFTSPDIGGGVGAQWFAALPDGRQRTDLAAAGSAVSDADDLTGFAASVCAPPLLESWLVGGAANTGAADLILLDNPGDVAASVDLTVYGVEGAQTPDAGTALIIPPGTQRVIPLAAIALGEESPVVRVTSSAAPVHAALQTSITRTLVPGGVDQVGTTALPAVAQTIPSFTVAQAPGEAGASEATTALRLLSPGQAAAATVTVTSVATGAIATDVRTVPLAADQPLELELAGLPIGEYSVRIAAEAPVVAALWQTTGFEQGSDFAWYPAAETIGIPSLFAVAPGEAPMLTITNDGDAPTSVDVIAGAGTGAPSTVEIDPGGAATVPVTAGEVYSFVPSGPGIRANVTYAFDGALAGYSVIPADAAAAAIVVYPQ